VAQGRLGSIGSESWWTKLPSNLNEMMGQASVEDQASAREILEGWLDDEVEAGRRYKGWNDAVQAALKQARQSDEDSGSHEREDSSSEDSDLELCVSDLKAQPIAAEINDLLINIYCGDDEVEEDQGTLERKLWKIHFRARQQNWERTLETIGKTVDGVKPISGWVDDFQPPEMQVEEPKAKYQVEHVEGEPTVGYSGKMNGAVHYRQHQEFPGLLQEIQRNRFELRREYSGRVQDTHVKKIVRDGEVSYQKYISVGDGTFFTDLEHECDHMRQQVRHFENTQEWLVTDLEIDGKEATEAQEKQHKRLQIYHFSALEQEVYMKEFLRLLSRGEVMTGTEALGTIVSREKDHTENIHKWMEHEGGHGPISKWYEETVQPFLGCRGDYLSKKGPFDKT
jgi:hypothetical protein